MTPMYLQTYEVAKRVGRSSETIRLWERLGRLPAIRTGRGMRLFLEADVVKLEVEMARKTALTELDSVTLEQKPIEIAVIAGEKEVYAG